MNKITLTTFTDPMMGLSYECEPIFRKLETHFAELIEFRYFMGLLVRNVFELADCNEVDPQPVEQLLRAVRKLLEQHPLISPIELREAFDFNTTDDVRQFIQPMIDSGEVSIRDVKRGWFIEKRKEQYENVI